MFKTTVITELYSSGAARCFNSSWLTYRDSVDHVHLDHWGWLGSGEMRTALYRVSVFFRRFDSSFTVDGERVEFEVEHVVRFTDPVTSRVASLFFDVLKNKRVNRSAPLSVSCSGLAPIACRRITRLFTEKWYGVEARSSSPEW